MKILKIKGINVLLDDEDHLWARHLTWNLSSNKRQVRTREMIDGKRFSLTLHRMILDCTPGDGKNIDHINRNNFDNRKENLRFANQQIQNMNRTKSNGKSSKYKGVSYKKQTNSWTAYIAKNKKQYHLGHFNSELDAANAYNNKAKSLFENFAVLNKIPKRKYKSKNE